MVNKVHLKYKKERVLLSDTLPYEVPVTFSNKHFYTFLCEEKIEFDGKNITWRKDTPVLDEIVRLLFGVDKDILTEEIETDGDLLEVNKFEGFNKSLMTSIPFGYNICHQENRYRELVVSHPRNQLQVVNFYDQFKELILYYCNISPFSIRKPNRVAKCVIYRDKSFWEAFSDDAGRIEQSTEEYANLRSFFVYKDYSNIYKFYESFKYHRCEKKYNKLLKIDISKCFDSIYTHSVAWAIYGKEVVKAQLAESSKHLNKTFGGQFDKLMQQLNYNETNGIVIGPEFSRIFAEVILQSVDRDLFLKLKNNQKLYCKKDYEIYRYVDDYFVFYNDDQTKEIILQLLQFSLKQFKLYLNPAKEVVYEKPIITEITIAKNKITKLITEKLTYKIEVSEQIAEEDEKIKQGKIYINPSRLITDFKTIIKESGVAYQDILNYTLSIIERKCSKIIKDYLSIERDQKSKRQFVNATLSILEFVFFIYSVSPRVNTTLKLCRILNLFTAFYKKTDYVGFDFRHMVFKLIYDNICFLLKKNKNSEHTQVETLYLLVALHELGSEYWLDLTMLCEYFNISETDNDYQLDMELNYFSLTVLLFYMRNKRRYEVVRLAVEKHILGRFERHKKLLMKDAELTMLLFDTLSCPYVSVAVKKSLLSLYKIDDSELQASIINFRKYWFTKWSNFDFGKELDSKRSQEVY